MSSRLNSDFPAVQGGASLQFGLADYIGRNDADAISAMAKELDLAKQMGTARNQLNNPTPDSLNLSAGAKANPVAAQTGLAQALQEQGLTGPGQLQQPGQTLSQPGVMPGIGGLNDPSGPFNPAVLLPIAAASAAGGLGIGWGMEQLFKEGDNAASPIVRAAQRIDNFGPSKWLNKHLSTGNGRLSKSGIGQQLDIATGKRVGVDVLSEHTEHMFKEMSNRFGKDAEGTLTKAFQPVRDAIKANDTKAATEAFEELGKTLVGKGTSGTALRQELLQLGKGGWRTRWGLRTFSNAIRGRHTSITMGAPLERAVSSLPKDVGPIGKMFVTVTGLFKRAVAAESLTGHGGGGKFGKLLGPMLGGGALFGFAFWDAHKAKKGDKARSFMHNFLGVGLGGLVGFELAEMLFKRTNLIGRLLPFASRGLPVALGPTLGGLAVFLIAQTIFFKPFSKIGEGISDKIFGKPEKVKEEELKKKGVRTETPDTFNPSGEQLQVPDIYQQFQQQKPSAPQPQQPIPSAADGPPADRIRMNPVRDAQDDIQSSVVAGHGTPNFENPLTDLNNLMASQGGGH